MSIKKSLANDKSQHNLHLGSKLSELERTFTTLSVIVPVSGKQILCSCNVVVTLNEIDMLLAMCSIK